MSAPKGFWAGAVAVAGLGAVGAFVFYGLYREWLTLPIFEKLTSQQTFALMWGFLSFTFLALVVMGIFWLVSRTQKLPTAAPDTHEAQALRGLDDAWHGVRRVNCDSLAAPMAEKAANALSMTATYWRKNYVSHDVLREQYLQNFHDLVPSMLNCKKVLPGHEDIQRRCCDLITLEVQQVYEEMKKHA